jgi:HEAT repeat protein
MGPEAEPALEPLLEVLRGCDDDLALLQPVVLAAMAISAEREALVDELRARLESPEPGVRNWSALMLGRIGPRAAGAVDRLAGALHDPGTSASAIQALRSILGDDALAASRGWVSASPSATPDRDVPERLRDGTPGRSPRDGENGSGCPS